MHHGPNPAPPVRVAGPALVLVVGPGAERAARAAFPPDVLLPAGADPSARLDLGGLVVVALEACDHETALGLVAAAQHVDRPADLVLVGGAPAPVGRGRLRAVTEIGGDAFVVERVPAAFDRRDATGPFDLIGDVHGCLDELLLLLARLGYAVHHDADGRPAGAHHPDGRVAVLVGDLVDRGPAIPGVLRLVLGMLASGDALAVLGNHDDKLRRALLGHDVTVDHGLDASLAQLAAEPEAFREEVVAALAALPPHLLLDGGRLVVAHAGLAERYHGRESSRVRSLCLYGPTSGDTDEEGLPVRLPWADDYRGDALVVYGHTPTARPEWRHGTICVDGGCVFGGALTAVRYPERSVETVPALMAYGVPVRPFLPAA